MLESEFNEPEIHEGIGLEGSQIPKVLHYCWFGGSPLGEKELSCIESWKKYLPEYKIVQWNEENFDVRGCPYASEAYDAGQWAFVSDYARFAILYQCGGLYFDTDVELIRPIDDIVDAGPFMGMESDYSATNEGKRLTVNPGLGLGALPHMKLYKRILESYDSSHFLMSDGHANQTTVVERITTILYSLGLEQRSGVQFVDGVTIYPSEYFCPMDYDTGVTNLTKQTRSIHHFDGSWFSEGQQLERRLNRFLVNHGFEKRFAKALSAAVEILIYQDFGRIQRKITKKSN